MKRFTVKTPARQPYLVLGFKTPVVGTADEPWEPYALEMLAYILDGGESSRLSTNLIRGSQLAVSADASYNAFSRLSGMLLMDAIPSLKTPVEKVEEALLQEIERFKKEPVSQAEMERVRNQIIAAKVYEKDSVFYQAMLIGQLETIGLDWRLADQYVDNLKRVTAEQIQQVAIKYLNESNLSVAVLDPLPMEGKVSRHVVGGRHGG
jgi:zinc protease